MCTYSALYIYLCLYVGHVHNRCADTCILLLQHGAEPSLRNSENKTALDVADPETTKLVLTGEYKKEELLEASRSGNEEKLMSLYEEKNVKLTFAFKKNNEG